MYVTIMHVSYLFNLCSYHVQRNLVNKIIAGIMQKNCASTF